MDVYMSDNPYDHKIGVDNMPETRLFESIVNIYHFLETIMFNTPKNLF